MKINEHNSIIQNVDIHHAKQAAFNLLIEKNNFIHSIDHAIRVHDNAMFIFNDNIKNDNQFLEKMVALKLAAYWHDTGKNDWSENEEIPHNIVSADLFTNYATKTKVSDQIIESTRSIILCHRNRGKDSYRNPETDEEKILWDADKLDIINNLRVTEIVWCYLKGYKAGEFNLKDTILFWLSITPDFADKFYFDTSRELFKQRFQAFKTVVTKINSDLYTENII